MYKNEKGKIMIFNKIIIVIFLFFLMTGCSVPNKQKETKNHLHEEDKLLKSFQEEMKQMKQENMLIKSKYDNLVVQNQKYEKEIIKIHQNIDKINQYLQQMQSSNNSSKTIREISPERTIEIKKQITKQLEALDREVYSGKISWRGAITKNLAPTLRKLNDKEERKYVHDLYREHLNSRPDFNCMYIFQEYCTSIIKE